MHYLRHSNLSFGNVISGWKVPVLSTNEIHTWFGDLNEQTKNCELYKSILSSDEIQQSRFFIGEKLQNRYLICHGVLKILLGIYSGVPPEKINLSRNSLDKPEWKNHEIKFNLTHSGNKFGIAFSRNREVGLDLEMIRDLADFDQMIQFNFTTGEQHYIQKKSHGFIDRFFQLWTIKESYLKLTGSGMRINPLLLDFSIHGIQIQLNTVNGKILSDSATFQSIDAGNLYRSSIAYYGEAVPTNLFFIP